MIKNLMSYLLLLGLAVLLAGSSRAELPLRQGKDRALFFVVSNYQEAGLTDLPQPIQNARAIAGVLEERYGFATEVVTDPDLQQITAKLIEYQDRYANGTYASDGQLLVFFSGHGTKEYGAGYFLPADANPDQVISTGLSYNNWRGFIDNINCRHILVAVDACYSVTFDPNWQSMGDGDNSRFSRKGELSESERLLASHEEYPARLFFTSDAQEDVVPGRSNFARKLLEGLSEYRSTQPYLPAEELFANYVKRPQPTPNAGDFGKDDPRSSFLFFPKARLNLGDARADRAAYQAAQQTNTLDAYRQYLRDYPTGDFRSLVQQKVDDLEAEEREMLAWSQVKQQNTRIGYETFIREYPNSIYVAVAENNLQATKPSLSREARPDQHASGGAVEDANRSVSSGSTTAPDDFVRISGGTFEMGDTFGEGEPDETPVHTVELSTFYMSKYEVTFAAYDAYCVATGKEKPNDQGWGRGQRPAINVSWYDAVEYANWLSEKNGLQPFYTIDKLRKDPNNENIRDELKWIVGPNTGANGYRLPTEAEWEYAARQGGQKVRFGNGENTANPAAINFDASASCKQKYSVAGEYRKQTVAVGSLRSPNNLGLHDMSGNVWEWCWDWWDGDYYEKSPRNNPQGTGSGVLRVLRGGNWFNDPQSCRAASRNFYGPTDRNSSFGFRLARSS